MSARAAGLGLALALFACGPESPQEVWVARVDGQAISLADLSAALAARSTGGAERPEAKEDALQEELDRLVSRQVVVNRARELGVEVTPDEVEARLRELHGGELGSLDDALREEARLQMLRDRTALSDLAGRLRVSEEDVLRHFEQNRDRYATPERVQVRQIVVADEQTARELREQIQKGADFAALARTHSLAPEAADGGLLPPFARGEWPDVFDEAFELEPGRVSRVLESPYGFHLLRLEERLPARPADLAEAHDRVVAELEMSLRAELEAEWLLGLRREAEIQVNERALEQLP